MAAFRVGMELGDNRVSMGLMDEHGSLWSRKVFSGNGLQRPQHFVETLCDHLEDLLIRRGLAPGDLDQIGLGVAGAVDTPSGTVWYSPGLFGEKNIPLAGLMEEQIGVLPTVVSVGGAAAYAEMRFGQGAPDSFIYLSLDRTVECGIVLNGKIYTGPSRMAGQLGHMVAEPDGRPCVCGQRGCLNTCIGSSALVALARERFPHKLPTEKSSLRDVLALAESGDADALALVEYGVAKLAAAVANSILTLGVGTVTVAGVLSEYPALVVEPLRSKLLAWGEPGWAARHAVTLRKAALGSDSAMIGAAFITADMVGQGTADADDAGMLFG